MRDLGEGAFHLPTRAGANTYLVKGREGLVLIDPGLRLNLNHVARTMVQHGLSPYHVTDVLLTHYDIDHAGSAAEWVRRTGARVWIGEADAAILRGLAPVPNTPFRRALALPGLPKLPAGADLVRGDSEIAEGIRAVPTPGHTPGHVAFIHRSVGFIGDSASVSPEATLGALPAFMDADPEQAADSRQRLQTLGIRTFASGHWAPAVRI